MLFWIWACTVMLQAVEARQAQSHPPLDGSDQPKGGDADECDEDKGIQQAAPELGPVGVGVL